ncbi:putative disease resistance protein RGA3 [Nymphaea colorata]|nr:putative disease resistance protein RGA3 [Nymphaea colorata]XP_031483324.1 putative disease resistance protein RGA3 [Nymphaea colorata]XP_049932932.1 putative disease resistance protein RGA3 [Nymphaea colorata]
MAIVIEALAEKAISILLEAVTSLLREEVDLILNAKDELKKLDRKLKRLEVALKDADRKPFFSSECDKYLEGELKDVFYDAQDIIEKYQTKIKLSKREKDSLTLWNKVRKPWITLCSCFKDVHASYKFSNETKKINERLDEIKKNWEMVHPLKTTPKGGGEDSVDGKHDNPRETSHHMGVQPPIGRGDDKKEIVKRLLPNDSTKSSKTQRGGVSIISIVGKGGIGKTTLAKMVFKETEEHFGKRRWWVCVSERPNGKDLLLKILKEVQKKSKEDDSSLNELCTQLRNELSKEKFLLVLDDVWETKWWEEEVEGTLMTGVMGSNILITSRNKNVSDELHASYMLELREFNFQQSWALFLNVALREGQIEQDLVMHNIKEVGVSIVKKCGGLPLVIKTVGSMMLTKQMSREDWKSVDDSKIWEWKRPAASSSTSEIGGDILPGLILSYDDLPYYLKSCFVYCCIYPKDYEIERERLIMQWVAHGLIEEKKHIDVEATANQYIQDLIRRCLIEENNHYFHGSQLKLHDILHDLASYIGGEEYSHASISQRTRHMSLLAIDDVEEAMRNATATTHKLRTLLIKSLPSEHLTNFKWLRVLSLRGCQNIHELPKSIEDLSLVKYLDLSGSHVKRLPDSIGRLYNLQTLDLSDSNIEELPKEMGKLCNLRYLGLKDTRELQFVAEGLGKLTNLWTLHRFMVCDDKGKTRGCNINELKDLKKLKGELWIEGLWGGRVKVMDAKKAHLKDKHELKGVKLVFKVGEDDKVGSASEQKGLLEALEPPHGIERLVIGSYKGDTRPAWYLDTNYEELRMLRLERCPSWAAVIGIKSLKELEVRDCPTLLKLPSMPLLKSLEIERCDGLKTIGDLPNLKSLAVNYCGRLKSHWRLRSVMGSTRLVTCQL